MRHTGWLLRALLTCWVLVFGVWSVFAQSARPTRPAVPVPAAKAIADAFRSHEIVAIPDAHGNGAIHLFNLSLVRDAQVDAVVDDIVVEFGNAKYQDILDRFERGEDVPYESLRLVWQNTTQANPSADFPAHEEFFRAVRTANASLPSTHQIRVLAGDPPIDWDAVHTPADYEKWIDQREIFPADLIRREVLAKHRRALLVYGQMHFQRQNIMSNYDMTSDMAQTIVSLLERNHKTKVFTVWGAGLEKVQLDVTSWPVPSIALLRGTVLGAADFGTTFTSPRVRFSVRDGKLERVPQDQYRTLSSEEQLDAVLYLGRASDASTTAMDIPRALCTDPAYMSMRLGRIALMGPPAKAVADELKQHCAAETAK
jgi:hypothetical protein